MKIRCLISALIALAAASAGAAAAPEPADNYAERVATFANDQAGWLREWREAADDALRGQPQETRLRFAELFNALDRCERLLAELRIAPEIEFERRAADYLQARNKLLSVAHTAPLHDQRGNRLTTVGN